MENIRLSAVLPEIDDEMTQTIRTGMAYKSCFDRLSTDLGHFHAPKFGK